MLQPYLLPLAPTFLPIIINNSTKSFIIRKNILTDKLFINQSLDNMKKIVLAAVALICMTMSSIVLSACGNDKDSNVHSYTIYVEFKSAHWEEPYDGSESGFKPSTWMNSILDAYKNALGVSSESFTLNGTQSECDTKVQEACKKAETTVATIKGGSGTVTVRNTTVNKIVYTYQVNP